MPSPELERARRWYEQLLTALTPPDAEPDPGRMRTAYDEVCATMSVPEDVDVAPHAVGKCGALWVRTPGAVTDRAVLYLHPGGYAVGSAAGHCHVAAAISRASGASVLALDYRLAPEHPHPAAVDDASEAFRDLVASGIPPDAIAIVGDSAGGGLCLATLVALRDAGGPMPACGVAVSPWTDLALTGESMRSRASEDPVNSAAMLGGLAQGYLMGADPLTPLASPLYAELSDLPPLLVMAGTAEVLLDDAVRFARRAQDAGVDVTLRVAPEMIHIWTFFAEFLPEGQNAIDEIGAFVRERTAGRVAT